MNNIQTNIGDLKNQLKEIQEVNLADILLLFIFPFLSSNNSILFFFVSSNKFNSFCLFKIGFWLFDSSISIVSKIFIVLLN